MGFSLDDLNKGVADVGQIIGNSMDALNTILGKATNTPPITAPAPTQPQTTSQPQGTQQDSGTMNLMFLALAVVLLVLLFRR